MVNILYRVFPKVVAFAQPKVVAQQENATAFGNPLYIIFRNSPSSDNFVRKIKTENSEIYRSRTKDVAILNSIVATRKVVVATFPKMA